MVENKKLMDRRNSEEEKYCQSMIESILCYNWYGDSVKECLDKELKSDYSYLKKYVKSLGYDRVLSFMEETANEIECINRNVGEDHEGCTYNSIKWKEA